MWLKCGQGQGLAAHLPGPDLFGFPIQHEAVTGLRTSRIVPSGAISTAHSGPLITLLRVVRNSEALQLFMPVSHGLVQDAFDTSFATIREGERQLRARRRKEGR